MWADLRQAYRGLRRERLFAIVAAASIALAVGVNATIFGVVDAFWFRPPSIPASHQIAWISATTKESPRELFSWPEFDELRARTQAFSGVVALGRRGANLHHTDKPPELLLCNVVSRNFFSTLGVTAQTGRVFTPADEALLRRAPVVVLGHTLWQTKFGADPSVVGRHLPLGRRDAQPVLVLGVLPPSFRDVRASADRDLWFPADTWELLVGGGDFRPRDYRWFELLGRLHDGAAIATAETEIRAIAAGWGAAHPEHSAGRSARVTSDLEERLQRGGVHARALLGIVLLVVLITCVNVACLLLARAARRTRDVAVRLALGASRARLIQQLLVESSLLGLLGGIAGAGIAGWLLALMPSILVPTPGFRSGIVFSLDERVLLFTALSTAATVVLFGLAPALTASQVSIAPVFQADCGRASVGLRRSVLWNVLLAGQIAVAFVLLCTTASVLKNFFETQRLDLGFARKPLVLAWFALGDLGRHGAEDLQERLRALAGVRDVAIAFRAPLSLSGGGLAQKIYIPGMERDAREGLPEVKMNPVGTNYFRLMGIPLLRGREFTPADQNEGEPVVIVSEQFARTFFGEGDPVGRLIAVGGPDQAPTRVIGVVGNAVINSVREHPEPYMYLPYFRAPHGDLTFLIEPENEKARVLPAVERFFRSQGRDRTPQGITTMDSLLAWSTSSQRTTTLLTGTLGILGLLLTALGIYGVVAYSVTQRVREIGIRLALGAPKRSAIALVVGDGIRLLAFGLAVGLPIALAAQRWLEPLLQTGAESSVVTLAVPALVLIGTTVVASLLPALRAAAVDPATAFRDSA